MIHPRQQNFFREVASLGHDVLCVSPTFWGQQSATAYQVRDGAGSFMLNPLYAVSDTEEHNIYTFTLMGLPDALRKFSPDWVYVHAEPGSKLGFQCAAEAPRAAKLALFTWENMAFKGDIPECDLIVCGNSDAETLAKRACPAVPRAILPQVGVDTDHFQARPIKRDIGVAYVGRQTPEKGLDELKAAYPLTRFLPWKDYRELPWWYSQAKIVGCYSLDTPYWREQAMPYVAVEAISCGAVAVCSKGGSIPFWAREYAGINPGVVLADDVADLKLQIEILLANDELREASAEAGRMWVEDNLSSRAVAKKLIKLMEVLDDAR